MSNWKPFLATEFANALNIDSCLAANQDATQTYLIPLLNYGLIQLAGPDAAKFLQGQVTCDVRELTQQTTRLGAQCNIKGRMLLCFRALSDQPDRIFLRVNQGLVEKGLASLGKYIVFSKAKLSDASQGYRIAGIAGPNAAQVLHDHFELDIANDNDWQTKDGHFITRIDHQRYEIWLAAESAENTWRALSQKLQVTHESHWQLLDIQAGLGDINAESFELFTPQALNYQLVNGINFRKGCYTGQEIVARLHYRATLKRHMYRFEFPMVDRALPTAGSALCDGAGKNIAEVVLAAPKSDSVGELLAYAPDDALDALYLPNNSQKLRLMPLPYAIPTPNEDE